MSNKPLIFNGRQNGQQLAWREGPIEIHAHRRVRIHGFDFASHEFAPLIRVNNRRSGFGVSNVQFIDCYFWGGVPLKTVDCHRTRIHRCDFIDNRPYSERTNAAIKVRSRNSANGLCLSSVSIMGHYIGVHQKGDMEGGRADDVNIVSGWDGYVRELTDNMFPIAPGMSWVDGHINVANRAISAPADRHASIRGVNIHKNATDWLDYNVEENKWDPFVSNGGLVPEMEGKDWRVDWNNEMARRRAIG